MFSAKDPIADCPKRVAVLGCSTGYGLASRIVATFAGGADTIGVSLEREASATKSGSAGWYNNRAFEIEAAEDRTIAAHAGRRRFLPRMKKTFIERVREKFGQLDLLVYSMAAPVRTDPDTGKTYRSAIKPLGAPVEIKTLNTETGEVFETTIAPASEDEAAATVAVMGGDDWKRWIDQLADAGVLAPGFRTLNYTYIGSELTWPIYWKGTLGRAKVDLDHKAEEIRSRLGAGCGPHRGAEGRGHPGELGHSGGAALWDGAVQGHEATRAARRMHRADRSPVPDAVSARSPQSMRHSASGSTTGSFRPKFKSEVSRRWPLLTTETLGELADLAEYKRQFLRLFGFRHRRRRLCGRCRSARRAGLRPAFRRSHPAAIFSARWNAGRAMQRAM